MVRKSVRGGEFRLAELSRRHLLLWPPSLPPRDAFSVNQDREKRSFRIGNCTRGGSQLWDNTQVTETWNCKRSNKKREQMGDDHKHRKHETNETDRHRSVSIGTAHGWTRH